MEQIALRFYTRQEIAEITGRNIASSHFSREVISDLQKWGYAYQWIRGRGVNILSRDESPQMRLKTLLMKRLGLNSQIDALDFAWFMVAISAVEGFASMPYVTKEKTITELCGHNISQSTLRRWAGVLYETGNAERFKKGALWRTYKDETGMKRQEHADPESDEYKTYCAIRSNTLETIKQEGENTGAWGRMITLTYGEHGVYYYCPEIVLNAIGEDIDEIMDLVDEIVRETD